jgi:hypothetical protein
MCVWLFESMILVVNLPHGDGNNGAQGTVGYRCRPTDNTTILPVSHNAVAR